MWTAPKVTGKLESSPAGSFWKISALGNVESPALPKLQAVPLTSRCNPTPGSEALLSPAIYPPGEAQHLLIKNISIMVNDLMFFPLIQYNDRCKGKMRVRCFCNMLPALGCLEHQPPPWCREWGHIPPLALYTHTHTHTHTQITRLCWMENHTICSFR